MYFSRYNLHRNGEGDDMTRHAACPVLAGTKWGEFHKIDGENTLFPKRKVEKCKKINMHYIFQSPTFGSTREARSSPVRATSARSNDFRFEKSQQSFSVVSLVGENRVHYLSQPTTTHIHTNTSISFGNIPSPLLRKKRWTNKHCIL